MRPTPSTKGASGTTSRPRHALRRRPQAADRRSDAGGAGDLLPPPIAAWQDRHPARGARRPSAEDGGTQRSRPARRRPVDGDPDEQERSAGVAVSHIYCQECGFQNPESANYCSRCGALLVREETAAEATQTFTPDDAEAGGGDAFDDLGIKGPALVVRSGGGR